MLLKRYEHWWAKHFLRPHFTYMGRGFDILKPWNVEVNGANIRLDDYSHVISTKARPIVLSTWVHGKHQGNISIGKYALICPQVRINSAVSITIGDSVMIANGCYISDADWHDLYDRTEVIGLSAPVVLEDNVWLGDSCIVNKGVTIGENSVIGAFSNVTKDIPPNVIAGGNPCKVIRPLDPDKELVKRENIFKDYKKLQNDLDFFEHYNLDKNTFLDWLRTIFFPRAGD
jgi:acetyltransferase-like isoleucine patch superfamily enzyme